MATTLLIVDDSENLRRALRECCEQQSDLEVVGEASDGAEAIHKATQLRPDVAVLDVRMPDLNGIETAFILKKRLPSTYLILFTLYDESVGSRLTSLIGVDLVVSKSAGISALLAAIRSRMQTLSVGEEPPGTNRRASAAGHS